jgi:hypothetical protein
MTPRNNKRFSGESSRRPNNEQRLVKKLDLRRTNYFKYDATEVFNSTEIEQKIWNPYLASIVTKASRISIKDAKDYIFKLEDEGLLAKPIASELAQLLDKYKRWR